MKTKLLSLIRVISFILILTLIISGIYKVLSWKDTSGDYLSSVEQLYSTEDNLIDVAFVGSSHVYNGVYPSILWSEHGISAFDIAISGQDKESAYYSLVELLKTQSPKIVFVDLYALTYEGYNDEGNLYRNSLSLKPSINSYNLIKSIAASEDVSSHVSRFPIIHTRYRELTSFDFETNPLNIYSRGEHYSDVCLPLLDTMIFASSVEEVCDLSDTNRAWLDRLIELSIAENFTLGFMVVPYTISYDAQAVINGAAQYLSENGIPCFDFNKNLDLLNIDISTDFTDYSHLNYLGAQKLTSWLGTWLSQNHSLVDHRGDNTYYQWAADAHLYQNYLAQFQMNKTGNLAEMLSIASTTPDFITALSLSFNNEDQLEGYEDAMSVTGISKEEFLNGGFWICKRGSFIKVVENDFNQLPYYEQLTDSNILRLHYDSSPYAITNISIGHNNYNTFETHATVIVYDTYTQQVIYHGGQ